ncbi:small nucleolar ribonucleoprotein-like protein complex subunit [Hortaea werneckii]|nr:small nucleolar ribonucleoprotein-like protein complex subunit [Hortaea werneckii]KAI7199178.1 small nucleolar ribonucleoprotein-like protein complex subunit [Hortaea werneckii]KAI7589527.1 small nucleolar ribonucleoprotein-like protein complex subunit [Hortaea werneckii]
MAYKADVKTTFEPRHVIQPIYTGGSVALSQDGRVLASSLGEEVLLTDLNNGEHLARIEGDGEPVTTLALTPDTSYLAVCSRSLSMRIFALQPSQTLDEGIDARLLRTLKPHSTPVVTATVDSTSSLLATGGADGVVKVWDLRGGYTTHTFHGHSGVISALHFFQVDPADSEPSSKSKKKKSKQRSAEEEETQLDQATAGYRLASAGEDGRVRVWDLHKRKSAATLDGHVSVVRSLSFSPELKVLLSASRDKTVALWDAKSWQQMSTVAVLEGVESAGFVGGGRFFYTGGETARLRLWSTEAGVEITQEQEQGVETEAIIDVQQHDGLPFLLSVHADQTLVQHSLQPLQTLESSPAQQIPPLPVIRRISGTHDEIIDLAYVGSERNFMALATNLEDIRLISLSSGDASMQASSYFGADVGLLKGHSDIIITLSVDWSGHWLATGAKDNTAKLWRLDPVNGDFSCYATFTGHAESIGAAALPTAAPPAGSKEYTDPLKHPPKFLITGSQDKTVKRWDISTQSGKVPRAAYTRKAHDKDINAIATSPSSMSPLFASASQDRTVKIWDVESGEAIGVLRGHKRGVWSVAFSPPSTPALTTGESGGASSSKGMVVTGSGDKTVRVWSLSDYSCLRTFEGHVNSVLKVVWLPPPKDSRSKSSRGVQVASAAGDGLVKVWDAQEGECAATLDNHIDRVWALAVKPSPITGKESVKGQSSEDTAMVEGDEEQSASDEPTLELVSGSADSTLTFWNDTTATTALEASAQATQRVEQDQELQNHIRSSNYREAIVLALQLNHPKRLLDLFSTVVNGPHEAGSFVGKKGVDEVIATLSDGQLWNLLRRVRDWNANARTHNVAQHVLYAILRLIPRERLVSLRTRRRKASAADEEVEAGLTNAMAELSTKDRNKESVKDVVDGLKAYSQRHYDRLDKTADERFVLLWALQQMDSVGGDAVNRGLTANGDAADQGDMVMLDGITS